MWPRRMHPRRRGGWKTLDTEHILARLAASNTRRSFLGKVGKAVIGAVGIATVSSSIEFITPRIAGATNPVCAWDIMCGIWGQPCASCNGGNYWSCPSSPTTYLGSSSWYYCCSGHLWSYGDCCTRGSQSTCTTEPCHNNPGGQQPTWCPTDGPTYYYYCSIVTDSGFIC